MSSSVHLSISGRDVPITHPEKVIFPEAKITKLQLIDYYLGIADGVLRGIAGRPMILKRFVKGIYAEAFFQKRAPRNRPDWIETAELHYASGTSAVEAVIRDPGLAWILNLGCIDLNPHAVLAEDLDHPNELRIDLDPVPGVSWEMVVDVAFVVRDVLSDYGLTGWPKTSGSKGFHVYATIKPEWTFAEVRLAAETVAREVAQRAPNLATSRWWKEERQGVFVDFNQNAKDRTVASVYSVRPMSDARVSTPLLWSELRDHRPEEFTISTVAERYNLVGDPWRDMATAAGSLTSLLELAEQMGPPGRHPKERADGNP